MKEKISKVKNAKVIAVVLAAIIMLSVGIFPTLAVETEIETDAVVDISKVGVEFREENGESQYKFIYAASAGTAPVDGATVPSVSPPPAFTAPTASVGTMPTEVATTAPPPAPGTVWTSYTGAVTIKGSTNANRVTVLSGDHDIILDGVDINVSIIGQYVAFDIQGNSKVNLTLKENTINKLQSYHYYPALQVQTLANGIAEVNIIGSGTLKTKSMIAASIGGANENTSGIITIGDNANVIATAVDIGAGIGGGKNGDGGVINITDNANVVATGGTSAAGIGGGYNGSGGTITIDGNATVNAKSLYEGAGIGGGAYAFAGDITIKGQATVNASGNYGHGIGSGFGYSYGVGQTPNIEIGSNANIIATTNDSSKSAIDNNLVVVEPENEQAANILELNFASEVIASSDMYIVEGDSPVLSYYPTNTFVSIAMTGLEKNKQYSVLVDNKVQESINYYTGEASTNFILERSGMNLYYDVQNSTELDKYLVTFRESSDPAGTGKILAQEAVSFGQNAAMPIVPLLREYKYVADFNEDELLNITSDKELYFDKEIKTFQVEENLNTDTIIVDYFNTEETEKNVFEYDQIAKAVYKGTGNVVGWKINDETVSLTGSRVYAFYVTQDSNVEPIISDTALNEVNIYVDNTQYSTTDDQLKIYYPIITSGYENAETIKYGVLRSTAVEDMQTAENTVISDYIAGGVNNNIKEYTNANDGLGVMNGDGRYNYVAVVPKNTDKKLYMQAWIYVDGVVYYTDIVEKTPSQIIQEEQ